MAWPLSQDYNEAIQAPHLCFADAELRPSQAHVNALGIPMPYSGNFADVYQMTGPSGKKWAVKCFTRQVSDLRERYAAISAHLTQVDLPFMVDFAYLEQGIRVHGQWYPILKMDWIEGFTLNGFVGQNADNPALLEATAHLWRKLARRLRAARIAHGDLQHGNVLLVPGRRAGALSVRLIDYDGLCVAALVNRPSGEVGHPAYQHPQRLRQGGYNLEVDRFSHLVIYTALRGLIVGGSALWKRYDNGDNLLFRQPDLAAPAQSPLVRELVQTNDAELRRLVDQLSRSVHKPLEETPLLDELVKPSIRRSSPRPLRPEWQRGRGRLARWPVWIGTLLLLGLMGVVGILHLLPQRSTDAGRAALAPPTTNADRPVTQPASAVPEPQSAPKPASGPTATPQPIPQPPSESKPPPEPTPAPEPKPEPKPEPVPRPVVAADSRTPVPDSAAQEKLGQAIRAIFKDEYARLRTVAARADLAARLCDKGMATRDDPSGRYVLLREARDLAIQAGEFDLALKASDALAKGYQVNGPALKAAVFEQAVPRAASATGNRSLVDAVLLTVDDAVSVDDYDTANRLVRLADAAARKAKSSVLVLVVVNRSTYVYTCRKEFHRVKPALETLATDPRNEDANLVVGKFLCFVKGDWKKGVPLLARGADERLRTIASQDQQGPTDGAAQVELGDAWYDLSTGQDPATVRAIRLRAYHWYEKAAPGLTGLTRQRVDRRMAEVEKLHTQRDQIELFRTVLHAVQMKQIQETPPIGGGLARTAPFQEIPPDGALLIGFEVSYGTFVKNTIIKTLRPIYWTADGEKPGTQYGRPMAPVVTVKARKGYAVGGMTIRGVGNLDGFSLTYMRVGKNGLKKDDTYQSDWVGGKFGSDRSVGGDGTPIIGICGKKTDDGYIAALGVVLMKKQPG